MSNILTIQVIQRNGKKTTTSIVGLAEDLDSEKIMSYLKKKLKCNGFISNDPVHGEIISLTGNHKEQVYQFLVSEQIYKTDEIVIKGI